MRLNVYLTGAEVTPEIVKGHLAVIIDVLRASTTIITALDHGAKAVIPVATPSEAQQVAACRPSGSYLLCGEQGGLKIPGYHLGNSPLEYTSSLVSQKTLILTTSNGTPAIRRALNADQLVIAGFRNAARVAQWIHAQQQPVAIICAGRNGAPGLDDLLCAGLLVARTSPSLENSSDGTQIAYTCYQKARASLEQAIASTQHAQHLIQLGYAEDVAYCSQVDQSNTLPIYQDGCIVPL